MFWFNIKDDVDDDMFMLFESADVVELVEEEEDDDDVVDDNDVDEIPWICVPLLMPLVLLFKYLELFIFLRINKYLFKINQINLIDYFVFQLTMIH